MKTKVLGLLAETSLHPGAGQDTGFVDLPVAREAATEYPVIVGSSFKGALLDHGRQSGIDTTVLERVFGKQESAGSLVVSDVRLVLLPVRSLTSHYRWVTCPHLLERLGRDLKRADMKAEDIGDYQVYRGHYLGAGEPSLFLEERQFSRGGDLPSGMARAVGKLICHDVTRGRLERQMVVLHDDDFAWFARFGLAVNARNVLNKENKTSNNLWYEESIPPDSLFYSLLADRNGGSSFETVTKLFADKPYIQVGGNETVGMGWLAIQMLERGDA